MHPYVGPFTKEQKIRLNPSNI